jgi:hypothetical protein
MSEKFQIKDDLPMPVRSTIPPLPLDQIDVGKYIVVEVKTRQEKGAIRQRIHRYQNSNPPAKFSLQTIDDTSIRIFRIEDAT